MNESLQNEVERLKRENGVIHGKMEMVLKEKRESMVEVEALKVMIHSLFSS